MSSQLFTLDWISLAVDDHIWNYSTVRFWLILNSTARISSRMMNAQHNPTRYLLWRSLGSLPLCPDVSQWRLPLKLHDSIDWTECHVKLERNLPREVGYRHSHIQHTYDCGFSYLRCCGIGTKLWKPSMVGSETAFPIFYDFHQLPLMVISWWYYKLQREKTT